MSWNTPKDALADVLSKLGDDAEVIEVRAWCEHGQVYCTTTIVYPSKIEGQYDAKHCKARCDC